MLRKLAVAVTALLAVCTLAAPSAFAGNILLPGVGTDMACDTTPYRIKTVDGYALQVGQDGSTRGNIIQWWVWGGSEQQWLVCKTAGDGPDTQYTFWNLHNKDCMNMWGMLQYDGAYFANSKCGGGAHQRFKRILDPETGLFVMYVVHSGKFMSVLNNNNAVGTIMAQYSDQAKLFYLEKV